MSTRTAYLLPCTCGEKLVVDKSQAGLTIRCHCGKEVHIPTLRGFAELEQTSVNQRPAREWSARQGVLFIGIAITVLGLLAAGWFALGRPRYPYKVENELLAAAGSTDDMQDANVEALRRWWNSAQMGVANDTSPYAAWHQDMLAIYNDAAQTFRARMTFAASVTAIGFVILCAGYFMPKRGAK